MQTLQNVWKKIKFYRQLAICQLVVIVGLLLNTANAFCYPTNQCLYALYPNGLLAYYGITVSDPFFRILEGDFNRWPEELGSVEYSHILCPNNPVRRFFSSLVGIVYLALNGDIRAGKQEHTIYEVDPYIGFRWANFPWNHFLTTSFALGEGISYVTSIPSLEKKNNDNTKRLLNFMLVEFTFASPSYPRIQLVARVHHRSGAFGLYRAGNTGSNVLALGVRYLF